MRVRQFDVQPNIPERLAHLQNLAMNLWFCWNWEAVRLFIRLDAKLWESCYQNPVLMLGRLPQEVFEEAAQDESFIANLEKVYAEFFSYLTRRGWFERAHPDKADFQAAYFSCEYGIDEGLPIYSGGLGILSGDHLKSASDLGLPLVGVGLLYQKGYFQQQLNLDGWQQENYPGNDWYNMPVALEHKPDGSQVSVTVPIAGESVVARVWRVQVGRTPLYLLDTNIPENSPRQREITGQLYGGDRDMRIRQEVLLGIGGVKALAALGLKPTVYHINEGHSAFMCVERVRELVKDRGLTWAEAREFVWATTVFTTHTPVPAGNEVFDLALVKKYLAPAVAEIGITWDEFAALGGESRPGTAASFSMPALALRLSAFTNGVSKLHGRVSRKMWHDLWPDLLEDEVPIKSVTNGVHTRSWISHDMVDLLDRYLGPRFMENPEDQRTWDNVDDIPDTELWRVHELRRERMVFFVRKRLRAQLMRQGAGSAAVELSDEVLDPAVLTLGFARRFAAYKRGGLLLTDPERFVKILTDPERPVQIVFAGKAHPQDNEGKELIKAIIHFARQTGVRNRVVFIEDYDINVARYLVQGCDVWVNTPVRPQEASGTSGMKASANGLLNLSVLDGWWGEGFTAEAGWMLGERTDYADPAERDRVDSEALYNILEREVAPIFYERDRTGVPRRWIKMMKTSLKRLGGVFNTHRMVREYTERAYLPAHAAFGQLSADSMAKAREIAKWRAKVRAGWAGVSLEAMPVRQDAEVRVGDKVNVRVRARLGALAPEDVLVQAIYGSVDHQGNIVNPSSVPMRVAEGADGAVTFEGDISCTQSGQFGFAVRAVPFHKDLIHPFTPPLVTWEK